MNSMIYVRRTGRPNTLALLPPNVPVDEGETAVCNIV